MEQKRDISIGTFTDVLGRETHVDPFGNNKHGDRAYRRLERIVGAIFLLTNHIPTDPLKREIRTCSLTALRQLLSMRTEMRNVSSRKASDLAATLRNIATLIKLLALGGLVSLENGDVIIGAIEDFNSYVQNAAKSTLSETNPFSKDDFIVSNNVYKGHQKDNKDKHAIKDITGTQSTTTSTYSNSRRASIIDTLRTTQDMSITEVAMNLPEYGAKTIQRELAALVVAGDVVMSGSKRWSRYSIKGASTPGE